MPLTKDNHFVPCLYLERFAHGDKLFIYRTLVEHDNVHKWKPCSPRGVGYFQHLYTSVESGLESDHVEKWLNIEIEEPAKYVLNKAVSGSRISYFEWLDLIRFAAAQDVRTPAYFSKCLAGYSTIVPETTERSLQDLKEKLEQESKFPGQMKEEVALSQSEQIYFPMRTSIHNDGDGMATIKAEVHGGRSLWLYEIQRLLMSTWKTLTEHRWTVLEAPDGITWFTSDDPVIKLRTYSNGNYDFGGGWNSLATEILLPLSPTHLLYAKTGSKPPVRGHVLSSEQAMRVRRLISEHAHRAIYSNRVESDISSLRKRRVDPVTFKAERDAVQRFHQEQTDAEWDMLTRPFTKSV